MRNAPIALCLALSMLLPACNTRKVGWELGAGMTGMTVASSVTRGPYLDVVLEGAGVTLRTFTPASQACAEILRTEATVDYVARGWGRFRRDSLECDAVGIGEPWLSRGRTGRASTSTPIPRAQATFDVMFEDDEVLLLRGRFPLASLLEWAGSADTVAVLPRAPGCPADESGVASMEYRASGRNTLSILGTNGLCRIEGLIQPPPPEPNPAADDSAQ